MNMVRFKLTTLFFFLSHLLFPFSAFFWIEYDSNFFLIYKLIMVIYNLCLYLVALGFIVSLKLSDYLQDTCTLCMTTLEQYTSLSPLLTCVIVTVYFTCIYKSLNIFALNSQLPLRELNSKKKTILYLPTQHFLCYHFMQTQISIWYLFSSAKRTFFNILCIRALLVNSFSF